MSRATLTTVCQQLLALTAAAGCSLQPLILNAEVMLFYAAPRCDDYYTNVIPKTYSFLDGHLRRCTVHQ